MRKQRLQRSLSQGKDAAHLSVPHIVDLPIGLCRNGTSSATNRSPRGSIQTPRPGRIENTPPMISSSPTGSRIHRECG